MTEHFTRNTYSAEFYCSKCGKRTQHRIDSGRKGPCLDCIKRLDALHQAAANTESKRQGSLFGEAT
jgi:hypothetical protein